jgi:hypothetical protein
MEVNPFIERVKLQNSFARILVIFSLIFIAATAVVMMYNASEANNINVSTFNEYTLEKNISDLPIDKKVRLMPLNINFCPCTYNPLAWSWIIFGISLAVGIIYFVFRTMLVLKEKASRGIEIMLNIFLIIQAITFIVGLGYFIYFLARLINVIS